jgi:hypothetical protein
MYRLSEAAVPVVVYHTVAAGLDLVVISLCCVWIYALTRLLVVVSKSGFGIVKYFGMAVHSPFSWVFNYIHQKWTAEPLHSKLREEIDRNNAFAKDHYTVTYEGCKFIVNRVTGHKTQIFDNLVDGFNPTVVGSPAIVNEMALPTSKMEVFDRSKPEATTAPGVIALRQSNGDLIGMGFRTSYKGMDVLATACHVWEDCMKASDPRLEAYGSTQKVQKSWLIVAYSPVSELDFVYTSVPSYVWAALSVKSLKAAKPRHGTDAKVFGYTPDGFCFSTGVISISGEFGTIDHSASSTYGWSGSPIMVNRKVVGIHSGADRVGNKNIGYYIPVNHESENDQWSTGSYQRVVELPGDPIGTKSMWDLDGHHEFSYSKSHVMVNTKSSPPKFKGKAWADIDEDELFFFESACNAPADFQSDNKATGSFNSILGKKDQVLSPREQGCATLEPTPGSNRSSKRRRNRTVSRELHSTGQNSNCLDGQTSQQTPNTEVSDSRSVGSCLVVRLTRKQEKVYNAICHTRAFQKALRESERPVKLRRSALDFAISSANASTGSLVQAFLGSL